MSARLAVMARGGLGSEAVSPGKRPGLPLELYEFEGCPFCRKVREAISLLELPTRVFPCPKGGTRHRPRALTLSARASFPTLVDPNLAEGEQVHQESDRIVERLFAQYGTTSAPPLLRAGGLGNALSALSSGLRRGGVRRRASVDLASDLTLYAHEGHAAARAPKEVLCELELPYLWLPDPRGGTRDRGPSPRLTDGARSFEGEKAIVAYLEARYGAP